MALTVLSIFVIPQSLDVQSAGLPSSPVRSERRKGRFPPTFPLFPPPCKQTLLTELPSNEAAIPQTQQDGRYPFGPFPGDGPYQAPGIFGRSLIAFKLLSICSLVNSTLMRLPVRYFS